VKDAMNRIKKTMREPLVHFLLIGAALFLLFRFTNGPAGDEPNRIVVTPGQVEQMASRFSRTWMRPPTKKELAGLIESHVRDEVYYREAMAMGLHQSDSMVRRRMRLKLEFLLEDLSAAEDAPGDNVLTAYLKDHQDKFQVEPRVSFRQVYLNPAKRQDMEADAESMLAHLKLGEASESVGDPTLVPAKYRLATQSDIARRFGEPFARQVVALAPGAWTGPLYSGLGAHLVKVTERVEGQQPELSEVRNQVEREYQAQRRQELKDIAYRKLRENYEVVIQPPSTAGGKTGGVMAKTRPVGAGK
jgi:parvulin-like peptidyl-prolyl cis-trans isomerase-like protein